VCTQAPLDCFVAMTCASVRDSAPQRSAQPSRYRRAGKHHVSKPRWIELNLDLFETRGGDRVLMGDAARYRMTDGPAMKSRPARPIQISRHHEYRRTGQSWRVPPAREHTFDRDSPDLAPLNVRSIWIYISR